MRLLPIFQALEVLRHRAAFSNHKLVQCKASGVRHIDRYTGFCHDSSRLCIDQQIIEKTNRLCKAVQVGEPHRRIAFRAFHGGQQVNFEFLALNGKTGGGMFTIKGWHFNKSHLRLH